MNTKFEEYFIIHYNDYEKVRKKSSGISYTCKKCRSVAEKEHNKPECHLCEDWNGCEDDCKLSAVYCKKCKIRIEV